MKRNSLILSAILIFVLLFVFKNELISEPSKISDELSGTWTSEFEYVPEYATPGNDITEKMKSTIEFNQNNFTVKISDLQNNFIREYKGTYSVEKSKLNMKLDIQEKGCCFDLKSGTDEIEVCQLPAVKVNDKISIFLSSFMWDYRPVLTPGSFEKVN